MQAVVAEEIVDDTGGGGATVGSACAEAPSAATAPIAIATTSVAKLRMSASGFAQADR